MMVKNRAFPIKLYIAHLHFSDNFFHVSFGIETTIPEEKNPLYRDKRYFLHIFCKLIVTGYTQTRLRPVLFEDLFDKTASRD
jgi:hypothetical protein